MREYWRDADQKCFLLMLYSIFCYAFLVPAALCCQLTLTRLLTSRYDACVILRRSRTIWRYDHSSRFFTHSIVSFDERFRAGLVPQRPRLLNREGGYGSENGRLEPKRISKNHRIGRCARATWVCRRERGVCAICGSKSDHGRTRCRRLFFESLCGQHLAASSRVGIDHGAIDRCRL